MPFRTLSDENESLPPLRFNIEPEVGVMVAAEDVDLLLKAYASQIALRAVQESLKEVDNGDEEMASTIVHNGTIAVEMLKSVAGAFENLVLEASLVSGEGVSGDTGN